MRRGFQKVSVPWIIDIPAVRAAAKAVAEVFEHDRGGGNLQTILAGRFVEEDALDFCACEIATNSPGTPRAQIAAEWRCFDMLRAMNEDERASALALYHGDPPFEDETIARSGRQIRE